MILQNIKRTNQSGVPSIHSDDGWVCLENASGTSGNIQAVAQAVVTERQELSSLKRDQRRVHDIIAQHLNAYLAGPHPVQLLMLIQGAGGTGKTTLIEQITKTFSEWNTGGLLAKTETTRVATSLIKGMMLHTWAASHAISTPLMLPARKHAIDGWQTSQGNSTSS
jgi:hypothetical protein